MFTNLTKGDRVSFNIVVSGILNSNFKDVEFMSVAPYEVAIAINPELGNRHANLRPYFKEQSPEAVNPNDYDYVIVKHSNGTLDAVGLAWIVPSSIQTVGTKPKVIVIHNWSPFMEAPLKDKLSNLGANFVIRDPE